MKNLILQIIKFGIVGAVATVVDVGVLTLLTEVFHVDILLASAAGFTVSVIANYILSMLFVFKGGQHSKLKEFLIFVVLSVGGLLLNQLIMWVGTEHLPIHYLWVKGSTLFFVPVYNFVTRKIFLEKKA